MQLLRRALTMRLMEKVRKGLAGKSEPGFTIVELVLVMVISLIMLAGMIALVSGAFTVFNTSKDLAAVSDSARRTLSAMTRALRPALNMVNAGCTEDKITFYADIDNDQGSTADIETYNLAELVELSRYGAEAKINVTEPGQTPIATGASTPKIGSYVTRLQFYYFQNGRTPGGTDPFNPTLTYIGSDINGEVGMVRIVLTLNKGNTTRKFYQDVFLRVILRQG